MSHLSLKHILVRDFILKFQAENDGEPPSQKDIYLALGMTSWQVSRYIKKLKKAGELRVGGYEAPKTKGVGV